MYLTEEESSVPATYPKLVKYFRTIIDKILTFLKIAGLSVFSESLVPV